MTLEQVRQNPGEWVGYFGYGSLVNDDTRNKESFGFAGRLKGYRRRWSIWSASAERRAFGFGGVAALSVTACKNSYCDGLLIFDRKDHLPKVDEREAMYDRVALDLTDFSASEALPDGIDCYIYVGHAPDTNVIDPHYPILQSYVDAVMQGFLDKFGEEGVARFVDETDGWQTPIVCDRDRPYYPRSVKLSIAEEELIDHYLKLSNAPLVPLKP